MEEAHSLGGGCRSALGSHLFRGRKESCMRGGVYPQPTELVRRDIVKFRVDLPQRKCFERARWNNSLNLPMWAIVLGARRDNTI